MKQLLYIRKGLLEWRDVPDSRLQCESDALVRPFAVARCDLDSAFLFYNLSLPLRIAAAAHIADPRILDDLGSHPFQGPFPYGHECVAEVVSIGSDVTDHRVGDVVIVPFQVSCGKCLSCANGLTSHCETDRTTPISTYGFGEATGAWGGAMSDLVRVPHANHMLVPVPIGVDPVSLASASDNIPDGWRAVGPQLARYPRAPVLIIGGRAKSVGLYAAGLAIALGSDRVDYVDTSQSRLDIAAALGANPIRRDKGRRGFNSLAAQGARYLVSFDACGMPGALGYALRSLSPGGICTSASFYFRKTTPIPMWEMYAKSLTLKTGLALPSIDLPAILELVKSGQFDPSLVTTTIANWDDAATAFLQPGTKVVVKRDRILPDAPV